MNISICYIFRPITDPILIYKNIALKLIADLIIGRYTSNKSSIYM